jgi:hypothetical protein
MSRLIAAAAFVLLAACGSKSTPAPVHADPEPAEKACVVGGCSSQMCIEEGDGGISTCEYRAEYACYADATCERQADGACGWTETEALSSCLSEKSSGGDEIM